MLFILKFTAAFIVFIFIAVAISLNKQISGLKDGLRVINRFLLARYRALIELLNILKIHMINETDKINSLISLLNEYIEKNQATLDMSQMLKGENSINKLLEDIKDKMQNYDGIYENPEIADAISKVQEEENTVGLAIQTYNNLFNQVQTNFESFPASLIASIMNKSNPYKLFIVDSADELDDNYVDADEI